MTMERGHKARLKVYIHNMPHACNFFVVNNFCVLYVMTLQDPCISCKEPIVIFLFPCCGHISIRIKCGDSVLSMSHVRVGGGCLPQGNEHNGTRPKVAFTTFIKNYFT